MNVKLLESSACPPFLMQPMLILADVRFWVSHGELCQHLKDVYNSERSVSLMTKVQ